MYTEIKTYVLPQTTGVVRLKVPLVRAPLGVGLVGGELCLWALVDGNSPETEVAVRVYSCRHDGPVSPQERWIYYVGTAVTPSGVSHVFSDFDDGE